MSEHHTSLVRALLLDVISGGDLDLLDEIMVEDFRNLRTGLQTAATVVVPGAGQALSGEAVSGRENFKAGVRGLRTVFPDYAQEVHELVCEGDVVAGRWTVTATHTGTLFGIPGSGRRIRMDEAGFTRIRDGRIAEGWYLGDELLFLHLLGGVRFPA